jgi:hypothetical protein
VTSNEPGIAWTPVDFRPDPDSGYRAAYLHGEASRGYEMVPVVGWLIEQQIFFDAETFDDLPEDQQPACPRRRVVAACLDGYEVMAVEHLPLYWLLLKPGDREPTSVAAAAERQRRTEHAAALAEKHRRREERQ